MNVLYVTQYFSFAPTHASAVTTYEIVKRLAERGHNVTILVPSHEHKNFKNLGEKQPRALENIEVIDFISIPQNLWQKNFLLNGLACTSWHVPLVIKALKRRDFDIIISMYHPSHLATFSAYMISRFLKIPLIVKVYDLLPDETDPNIFRRTYKKALFRLYSSLLKKGDVFLVPSTEWMNLAVSVYGISEKSLVLFPNGVDTAKFNSSAKSGRLREMLGLENKSILLFAGRISRIRGLEYLIEAMARVAEKEPDARLLIIGEGPEKMRLVILSKRLGIENFVIFVNAMSHDTMPEFMCLADVAIGPLIRLPITVGTIPIKVLEYMACGKPVIACYGGLSKDLISGNDGVLINQGNVEELSLAIITLLENKDLAKGLGANARKLIEKYYDWNVNIQKLDEILATFAR